MGLFHEPAPIYQLQQEVSLTGNQHVLWCVLLGALASLVASFWLLILKKSRQYLNGKRQWLPVLPDGRRDAGGRHRHLLPGNRGERQKHHHLPHSL